MRKSPRNSKKASLLPIPVEGAFDRVDLDVLGPFPLSSKGSRYIVVFSDFCICVDRFLNSIAF